MACIHTNHTIDLHQPKSWPELPVSRKIIHVMSLIVNKQCDISQWPSVIEIIKQLDDLLKVLQDLLLNTPNDDGQVDSELQDLTLSMSSGEEVEQLIQQMDVLQEQKACETLKIKVKQWMKTANFVKTLMEQASFYITSPENIVSYYNQSEGVTDDYDLIVVTQNLGDERKPSEEMQYHTTTKHGLNQIRMARPVMTNLHPIDTLKHLGVCDVYIQKFIHKILGDQRRSISLPRTNSDVLIGWQCRQLEEKSLNDEDITMGLTIGLTRKEITFQDIDDVLPLFRMMIEFIQIFNDELSKILSPMWILPRSNVQVYILNMIKLFQTTRSLGDGMVTRSLGDGISEESIEIAISSCMDAIVILMYCLLDFVHPTNTFAKAIIKMDKHDISKPMSDHEEIYDGDGDDDAKASDDCKNDDCKNDDCKNDDCKNDDKNDQHNISSTNRINDVNSPEKVFLEVCRRFTSIILPANELFDFTSFDTLNKSLELHIAMKTLEKRVNISDIQLSDATPSLGDKTIIIRKIIIIIIFYLEATLRKELSIPLKDIIGGATLQLKRMACNWKVLTRKNKLAYNNHTLITAIHCDIVSKSLGGLVMENSSRTLVAKAQDDLSNKSLQKRLHYKGITVDQTFYKNKVSWVGADGLRFSEKIDIYCCQEKLVSPITGDLIVVKKKKSVKINAKPVNAMTNYSDYESEFQDDHSKTERTDAEVLSKMSSDIVTEIKTRFRDQFTGINTFINWLVQQGRGSLLSEEQLTTRIAIIQASGKNIKWINHVPFTRMKNGHGYLRAEYAHNRFIPILEECKTEKDGNSEEGKSKFRLPLQYFIVKQYVH